MIFKQFRTVSVALALAALAAWAAPASSRSAQDEAVQGAYDAYRAGDALKLARYAAKLEQHVLAPWVVYWRTALGLEDAAASDVRSVLTAYQGTYVAERLRGDWLKVLGKRGDWPEFEREAALYPRDELEVRCYGLQARLARGDETALAELAPLWLQPNELPPGCAGLADTLLERQHLSTTDVWRGVRVLFENGQITAAKSALGYLAKDESPDERALAEAARQPKRLLEHLPNNLERRASREVVV